MKGIIYQDGKAYDNPTYRDNVGIIARGYQTIIKEKLGFASYENKGVSGAPMAEGTKNGIGNHKTILDYQSCLDKDLIIITAGTNDFKLNVPLGKLGVIGDIIFDTNTFCGAYREAVEHILTVKPSIRIVLFTPLQRDNSAYDVNKYNSAGHMLNEYREAIISIGKMYAIPVCDMYANSGFTKLTFSALAMDGLHPKDEGYERMGGYAAEFIKNIGL